MQKATGPYWRCNARSVSCFFCCYAAVVKLVSDKKKHTHIFKMMQKYYLKIMAMTKTTRICAFFKMVILLMTWVLNGFKVKFREIKKKSILNSIKKFVQSLKNDQFQFMFQTFLSTVIFVFCLPNFNVINFNKSFVLFFVVFKRKRNFIQWNSVSNCKNCIEVISFARWKKERTCKCSISASVWIESI